MSCPDHSNSSIEPLAAARSFLRRLDGPKKLLVAVSGGSDSTGLLLAFYEALTEEAFAGFSLCAVTIDHALRSESADEAREVGKLCARFNIPHLTKIWTDDKPKTGLSDASRRARYQLLCEAAAELDADIILLGHTAGDQRETILMRRQRSTREDALGLAGMAEATLINRQIWACRPFLSVERDCIRAYLTSRHQVWIDDPSNDNRKYERVRIRQSLKQGEAELGAASAALRRYQLSGQAADFVSEAVQLHPNMLVSIDRSPCRDNPTASLYALSYLAAIIGGQDYPLSRQQLEGLIRAIAGEGRLRFTAHRCVFDLRKSHLYIYRELRNLPDLDAVITRPTLWDKRLWLIPTDEMSVVTSSQAPLSLLKAARASLPCAAADDLMPAYRIEAYLRPFDQFLPLFDYALARAIAERFAAMPFPAPPLGGFHPLGV